MLLQLLLPFDWLVEICVYPEHTKEIIHTPAWLYPSAEFVGLVIQSKWYSIIILDTESVVTVYRGWVRFTPVVDYIT